MEKGLNISDDSVKKNVQDFKNRLKTVRVELEHGVVK